MALRVLATNVSGSGKGIELTPATGHKLMISGWIYIDQLPAGVGGNQGGSCIMEQVYETGAGQHYSFNVFLNSNGQIGIRLFDQDSNTFVEFKGFKSDVYLSTKTWHHFGFIIGSGSGNVATAGGVYLYD